MRSTMQIIDEVVESIVTKPRSAPECMVSQRKHHRRVRRVLAHLRSQGTAGAHYVQQVRDSTAPNSSDSYIEEEEREWDRQLGEIEEFMYSARFRNTIRYHTAKDVLRLSSPIYTPSRGALPAQKLYNLLLKHSSSSTSLSAVGCIDPVQAVLLAPHCEVMYVSGWQTSITAAADNHTGPDLADYPYTSVPAAVERVVNAQEWHARVQRQRRMMLSEEERREEARVDYFRPVLADADTGHGSLSSLMRLTRLLVDAGAAGIHIEDQISGTTQISGFSGKTLVSLREAEFRLRAARLQCDISRAATVLVARTDAAEAVWLAGDTDEREHRFIVGVSNPRSAAVHGELLRSPRLLRRWERAAALCTYPQCVRRVLEAMVEEREERGERAGDGDMEDDEEEEDEEAREEGDEAERGGEKKGLGRRDGVATPDKERDLEELGEKHNSTAEFRRGNASGLPLRSAPPSAPSPAPPPSLQDRTRTQDELEDLISPKIGPSFPKADEDVDSMLQAWDAFVATCPSITHMRAFAAKLLREKAPYWSPEHAKHPDGHFRISGGQEYAIFRAQAFSGLADMVWVHTSAPSLSLSLAVMSCTRITHPHTLFLHSFPPSHNWHAVGLTDAEVPAYTAALEAEGGALLLVPQGGFHVSAMAAQEAGSALQRHGTLGFVRAVQRREQSLALSTLSHHQWSGAALAAAITSTATAPPLRATVDAAAVATAAPAAAPPPPLSTEPRGIAGAGAGASANVLSALTGDAGGFDAHVTAPWDIGVLPAPAMAQGDATNTRDVSRRVGVGLGAGLGVGVGGAGAVADAMADEPAALHGGKAVGADGVGWSDEEWLPTLGMPDIHVATCAGDAQVGGGVAGARNGNARGNADTGASTVTRADADVGAGTGAAACALAASPNAASEDDWRSWLGVESDMLPTDAARVGDAAARAVAGAFDGTVGGDRGALSAGIKLSSQQPQHSAAGAEQPWGWARSGSGRGGWRIGRVALAGEEAFVRALE